MRILGGVVVAALLAMVLANGSIAGIDAWKILLAVLGFVLFTLGGRSSEPARGRTQKRTR